MGEFFRHVAVLVVALPILLTEVRVVRSAEPESRPSTEPSTETKSERLTLWSKLKETPVRVVDGDRSGRVSDVIADLSTGEVPFVLKQAKQDQGWVSVMPVELGTLTLRNDNWRWRIPADATGKIEQTRHQPDGGGPNYSQALEWLGLFDVESRWQQQVADKDESVKLTTGEKLVRTHVVDRSSQAIGQITDFAIDLKSWRIAYVILILGDGGASAAPEGKRQLAIPLAAFRDGGAGKPWILEVPAAELPNIPAIAAGELPRETSPFWDHYLKEPGGDSRRGGLRPPEPTTNR